MARVLRFAAVVPLLSCFFGAWAPAAESNLAYPGQSGRMIYESRPLGDRIPNFSNVGYFYGERSIPTVPTAVTVQPGPGDDTAAIQAAINSVAAMPLGSDGFRGTVELAAGEFQISSSIFLFASGIVLRGQGRTDAGTVLRGTGTTQRTLVEIGNGGSLDKISSSERPILDKYVPVGSTSFRVADASTFNVGDQVVVFRPSTANWISDIGMDMIPPRDDGGTVVQWAPGTKNLLSDRVITRIEGERVFINAPLTNALDEQYGGGTIYKYNFNDRLSNIGIEQIKGVSDYDLGDPNDEDHAWSFIDVDDVEHAWVRDITAQHFGRSAVSIERDGKNVTVENAHSIDPISIVTGSRRYAFEVDGQLNLVRDATSDLSRHDYILNSPSPGPNVFVDSVATNALDETGPHQRWSTGALFDNIQVDGDQINLRNRGNFGTGHGWAGANMVVWNSTAESYIIQNPPTAQNWMVGSVGQIIEDTRFGQQEPGIVDQHGSAVDTRSLYYKQLEDRMHRGGELREYVTGDYDLFEYDGLGSVDDPAVSQSLIDAFSLLIFGSGDPTHGFDHTAGPALRPFTWSYDLASDEQVYHAVLSLSVRGTGGDTTDDSVWFEDMTNQLSFSTDLGFTQQLSTTESTVFALEFVASDLAYFQDGEFNVLLNNDIAIDWARLELFVADRVSGDFNGDGLIDNVDIDLLCAALDSSDPAFDLTGDGNVDEMDLDQLILEEIGTLYADANLDGIVDGVDFIAWNEHKFDGGTGWAEGNFNCDPVTDGLDFVVWNENKFQSADSFAVPEPALATWLAIVSLLAIRSRKNGL